MRIQLKQTELRLDAAMLLFPIMAAMLGEGTGAMVLILSLLAHEAAHLALARAAGISVHSLRLTPFGGLAQLDNPYAIAPARLCAMAAAGPLANLLILLCAAALCQWGWLDAPLALSFMTVNAMLMLFNLLPALPLDGGRILYALLSLRMPRARAVEVGILSGRILSALLVALSLWGLACRHTLNLSPLFAALFILASAGDERKALTDSHVRTLLDRMAPLDEPVPASLVAINADAAPQTALRALRPGCVTLFALYHNGQFTRLSDDRTLLNSLLTDEPRKKDRENKRFRSS